MKKSFYVFYLSLLFIGCNHQIDHFKETIISSSKEEKIWNYYRKEDDGNYNYLGYKYSFYKESTYKIFYSKTIEERGEDYDDYNIHGNSPIRKWLFDSNSMGLIFEIDSFIIERYNTDTIFMRGDGFDGQFIMVKMKSLK